VVPDRDAKSISHETTFAQDIDDREALVAWLVELAEQVARRLRRHKLRGRTVHLKVRFSDFRTITRAQTLAAPTDVTQEICQAALCLFRQRMPAGRFAVRLLGVGVSGFDNSEQVQQALFGDAEHDAQSQLDQATDQIRERFGAGALGRASGLLHGAKHQARPRPGFGGET
jgi:DNA polymerase-4